jgi:PhnB protein
MQASPHLHFQGRCREAFNFYAQTLGGHVAFAMTFAESPAASQTPPAMRDQIIHARLEIGSAAIMGCDVPPQLYREPQGFNVLLTVPEPAVAERVFAALARDGSITMPFAQTFWAYRFGMCTDRFGIPWMVNCEQAP